MSTPAAGIVPILGPKGRPRRRKQGKPMQARAITLGPLMLIVRFANRVCAGFPSPADDYIDAPIDLSRELIKNAPATFIMTVAGDPVSRKDFFARVMFDPLLLRLRYEPDVAAEPEFAFL